MADANHWREVLKQYRLIIAGSVLAVLIVIVAMGLFGISGMSALALFFGLEGTLLLASMLSPPPLELRDAPKTGSIVKKITWHFTEGRGNRYPTSYNPVFFYTGLILLAGSMTLAAISTAT